MASIAAAAEGNEFTIRVSGVTPPPADKTCKTAGGEDWPEIRLEDVPFDPASGEVLVVLPGALRTMPSHVAVTRLVAVGEAGETAIGEYTFAHTPG